MEAHEASHIVQSPAERRVAVLQAEAGRAEDEINQLEQAEKFRKRVALWVAVVAVLLAITAMAREHMTKEVINANIFASDTYNFFQAKNIRQTDNQIAADELEVLLLTQPPPEPLRSQLEQRLAGYKRNVARYESEPETGEGKRELLLRARGLEADRGEAQLSEHNLHYAEALMQIAIVLGSVSILALSRSVLYVSAGAALLGVALLVNGYFLGIHLPV